MSSFQLVAPLTETAPVDRTCEGTGCTRVISRGMPFFPIASHNPDRPPRNVCRYCFEKILKHGGTFIRERRQEQAPSLPSPGPPDPQEVQAAIRSSRSKASVNPPAVVAIPPGGPGHAVQPRRQSSALMPPPSGPVQRSSHSGPHVHVPSAWSSADLQVPGSSRAAPPSHAPSYSGSTPSPSPFTYTPGSSPYHFKSSSVQTAGYSKHHESYANEVERWSASATTGSPLAETISLSISALHEGGTRRGRSSATPGTHFGNITEGKKGVNVHMRAKELAALARKTINPRVLAFCPEFPWRPDEFMVRDAAWVDLGNYEETPETAQGYFYRECLQLKAKRIVFKPTKQFLLYVVVPQSQWDEYLEFVLQKEDASQAQDVECSAALDPAPTSDVVSHPSRRTTGKKVVPRRMRTKVPSSVSQPPPADLESDPLFKFCESEDSGGEERQSEGLESLMKTQTPAASTQTSGIDRLGGISIKRSHQAMHSRAGSIASATGKSPPTKKPSIEPIIKSEPFSPDRNDLREALRVGGAAKLDPLQLSKAIVYQVDFYPIPTVSINEILAQPSYCKFDLDRKNMVTSLHPGQLRVDGKGNSFVGAGAFKTAETAMLILSKPSADGGIGTHGREEIVVKRPYERQPHQAFKPVGPFKRLPLKEESAMLFREANVLYWAKALFKLTEDFISKRLAKASEPPPFEIPSIRFVDAGLAFRYQNNPPRGRSAIVDCAYLCEEEITDAESTFVKFVHNADCAPLLMPDEPGYKIAQFLVFTQHVQYVKTKRLAYVSDYQGTASLLTDPQILTHPSIGPDLFCEGNLEEALETFQNKHVCNEFCKWPGFKLVPLGQDRKGKGKAMDLVVLSSDSD